MIKFNVLLFNDFEALDVFGPIEVIGKLDQIYEIGYFSENGGLIQCKQNVKVETMPLSEIKEAGVILIPGGFGTRKEVDNQNFITQIKNLSLQAQFVLTVCTGSALLARTGLIKNLKATTNKIAFDWVVEQDREVEWIKKARWINDGKFYSSSGVSAGIDMALGFVGDRFGIEAAQKISKGIEYIWNKDKENDPFAG
jgi:transcriptional regulator GlxA family with amidase domain